MRREEGLTRTEILVIIAVIAITGYLITVTAVQTHPRHSPKNSCVNNLKQIGSLLVMLDVGRGTRLYSGAAFLLQVAEDVKDVDLDLFICPGDSNCADLPGTEGFVDRYRNLDLLSDLDDRHTSYLGPDWRKFPREAPERNEPRIIAADRSRDHHDGDVVVLYASGRVRVLEVETDDDARLRKLIYFPDR